MSATSNTLEQLASLIRLRRRSLGFSQQDVADLCGVQRQTIGRVEAADPTVGMGTVVAVTDVLGIDIVTHGAPA
ncbi:MAG: helix-turn-helix domain-containing protein [Actinomycetota bacterium]